MIINFTCSQWSWRERFELMRRRSSYGYRHIGGIALFLALSCASCAVPFDEFNRQQNDAGIPPSSADIQLSPPAEILPGGQERQGDGLGQNSLRELITASPTVFMPLQTGATPSPISTNATPIAKTPSKTASPSPTVTASSTITATLPHSTWLTTTSHTQTHTRTTTAVSAPTQTGTSTPSPTETQEGSPPPPPTFTNTAAPTAPPSCDPASNGSVESALITLINQERLGRGLTALSPQGQLATAARDHSADMACNNFFSHTGSDGSLPWDRVSALGYSYAAIAENIFAGSSNAQIAFDAWMNSPGHRENMLNPTYTEIGIGYRYWADSPYGAYTTAVLARPR